jgi:hypothetical protein
VSRVQTALLALALGACTGRSVEEQKSAGQIARAVEVLRDAPNPEKRAALGQLEKLACVGKSTCETRAACLRAYTQHVEALELTQSAKRDVSEGKAAEAATLLITAQEKLSEAQPLVIACTNLQAALRREHKL